MDTPESAPADDVLPAADVAPVPTLGTALQRARRRRKLRRMMSASTLGLLVVTGLLLAQQTSGQDGRTGDESPRLGSTPARPGTTPTPDTLATATPMVEAATGEDPPCEGMACGEPGVPLKISTAPPRLPPTPMPDSAPALAAASAPLQPTAECTQVAQEMAALKDALKDATAELHGRIDERMMEARTRQIFLHCAA